MTISIHYSDLHETWIISDEQSGNRLESVQTRDKAVSRARNKWAAPGQKIEIMGPRSSGWNTIREGSGQASSGGGGFGSGLF